MSTDTMNINETDLTRLAGEIRAAHEAAVSAMNRADALEHARNVGQLLLEAKELCGHGQWLPWLEANCSDIGARQIQKLTKLAKNWNAIAPRLTPDSQLSIEGALRLLSEDPGGSHSTSDDADSPDTARDEPELSAASEVRVEPVTAGRPQPVAVPLPPAPRRPAPPVPRPTPAPTPRPVVQPPIPKFAPTLWQMLVTARDMAGGLSGRADLTADTRAARIRVLESTAQALTDAAHRLRTST